MRLHFIRFLGNERGSVFIMMALSALMLITVAGASVDMARAQILQSRISTALDAAGLAAGNTANTINVETQAQKYFNANFPSGYLGSAPVTVTATLSADKTTVSLAASTTQPTSFMQIMGINSVKVGAASQITRATTGMELVMVLDNTGSMGSPVNPGDSNISKIQALISAITGSGGLLDILYGPTNTSIPNMWIGVVPFTDIINIGTGYSTWMNGSYDAALDYGPAISSNNCPQYASSGGFFSNPARCAYTLPGTAKPSFGLTNWAGCVLARSGTATSATTPSLTLDSSDDPPASTPDLFKAFYNTTTATGISNNKCTGGSNAWTCSATSGNGNSKTTETIYDQESNNTGANNGCIQARVLPMTATKGNVVNLVNTMTANGSTMINMGMAWGFRMLSPNWTGLWGGDMNAASPQLPLPYHTALMNKVIILMTDGMNNTSSGTSYQGQSTNPSDAQLDAKTEAICDAMKANGIIIYTIGFGTTDDDDPNNPTSVDGPLLKYCATQMYAGDTSHYFLAPTNAVLATAFAEIGDQLANLRVSE